jgi:hypothetical protein
VTIVGKSLLFAQAIGHRGTGSDWTAYKEKFSPRALFEKGQ